MPKDAQKRKIFGEISPEADAMLDLIKGARGYRNNGLALEEAIKDLHSKVLINIKNKKGV